MIILYGFGPAFGLPDASPFVTKVEVLLKMAGLPYRTQTAPVLKAPRGKLPYINDDGEVVADSTLIRWHLEKKYDLDFDQGLSLAERGVAWTVEKLLEDNLYWVALYWRWLDDASYEKGPATFFQRLPWPVRPVIETLVRRRVRKNLHAHGMGRHTQDEQLALARKSFDTISALLDNKPFLMGAKPCGTDATLFAFMAGVLCPYFDTPLRTLAEGYPNLVRYTQALYARYFPEQEPCLKQPQPITTA